MRTTAPELTNAVHMKISNPKEVAEARHPHLCQVPPRTARLESAASAPQQQLWPRALNKHGIAKSSPSPSKSCAFQTPEGFSSSARKLIHCKAKSSH